MNIQHKNNETNKNLTNVFRVIWGRRRVLFSEKTSCLVSHKCLIVRSLSAKYRPDRYRRDKSVKFGTELP